ncbi:TRAPP I complex [Coccomyxa subellipsoidea C-169]|uniref:Trafficking protein particle complex subunit n=1 Tax=Coccomyxa subellipsoidea (strain C-169) TaxID=574566 RepID=I0YR72_COCSC|nr:TRAPP I complex [Coccomyxa subellipsoidea C-169]EIE20891.1 TRAPP I complex [Coccomyxa subellipsoidea C-169]|eukprot:XP_005645435.1 TRAPP I complex [Coccomyxa subellipsoidea C-169]
MFSSPLYRLNIVDRPLAKGKGEVSLSAFSFLFSELVQYCQTKVSNIGELERRLEDIGAEVGLRLLEILCFREKNSKRDIRLLDVLKFVHTSLWKYLFGRQAKDLEQSNTAEDEYMISDYDLFVNKFISVPKDMGALNCAAFVAGIVKGVLDGAGFRARVTAHFVPVKGQPKPKTTILMKFDGTVLAREHRLPSL